MRYVWLTAVTLLYGCGTVTPPSSAPSAEMAVEWNREVLRAAEEEDRFLTLKGVRTAAMLHLAMHDALNSVEPRFAPWTRAVRVPDADPAVAAARAAFEVAVHQYPDQREMFEKLLDEWLANVPEGSAKQRGIRLGIEKGAAVLASREDDRWDGEVEYQFHPMAPGVYAEFADHSGTPEGFVFGAGWAMAKPFTLESPAQFRSPPPPEIESEAYARAFDEVKRVGSYVSETRTSDQSHLAMWWKDFVESSHNRLARSLTVGDDLDLWRASRMFALLNMSIYDAYVGVFDNKFHFNHWRPYTAIRWASHDGNPETLQDDDWDNLHRHTYAFPSYPSAHGTACASASVILADTFGDSRAFSMRTEMVDRAGPRSEKIAMVPPTRSFPSFAAAADECALSRVYLGIHFRYDSEEGTALGELIGSHVLESALLPRN